MLKRKLRLVELFSGIGFQKKGLEDANVYDIISIATCDLDIGAVTCYAAIHNELTPELLESYEDYPSREEMADDLTRLNIGYDFTKNKKYNWYKVARSKDSKNLLKKTWLACKLQNNLGDIALVEDLPDCDFLTFSYPCFVEGTMVLTKDGYKEIQDICVDDVVLTHNNKWQKVTKTMINEADKLIKINCMTSESIHCTENHPFYVRERHRTHNSVTGYSERYFDAPMWKKASELTKDFYVGTAINPIEELPQWNGINKKTTWGHTINENTLSQHFNKPEFWYVIGRYIGDGWLRSQSGIIICGNTEEIGQLYPYLDKLGWGYTTAKERTCDKVQIPFQEIGVYCEQFGKGAANKHLTSDILNLPVDLLKEFIKGYLDADGSFTQGRYKASSVSRRLMYEIAQCVMKAYHRPVSLYFNQRKKTTVIEGRTVNQKDSYQIMFSLDNHKQDKAFYEDGYIWSPINEINEEEYNGLVYNMEVEEDNSYVVQNVIVHNCTDISGAGKQKGIVAGGAEGGGTRSGLVYEVLRLVKKMSEEGRAPKYLLMENVDALVSKKFIDDYKAINVEFEELGYSVKYEVMNTKFTGIPQNRARVYALYSLEDISKFEFPIKFDNGKRLEDILEDDVDEKYYINNPKAEELINDLMSKGLLD